MDPQRNAATMTPKRPAPAPIKITITSKAPAAAL
jgi:hypothetical protein